MENIFLRFVGDLHGLRETYVSLVRNCPLSLQVGDLDSSYQWMEKLGIDPNTTKFYGGNHDNYDQINSSPHNLGDYGVWEAPGFGPIFFVRGGFSVDHQYRRTMPVYDKGVILPKNLWEEEELTMDQCRAALELYKQVKPKILASHEAPLSIVPYVSSPGFLRQFGYTQEILQTRTNQLLQAMIEAHAPKLHVFGHYHKEVEIHIGETRFVCLGIADHLDIDKEIFAT